YTPVMLRCLGKNEYGVYSICNSFITYLGLLNFGLGSSYVRYYTMYKARNDEEKIKKLNGLFLKVFIIIGIIVLLVGGFLDYNISWVLGDKFTGNEIQLARKLFILMTFNMAVSMPNSVFTSFISANEKFVFQKLVELIKVIGNPFVTVPLLLLGYRSVAVVMVATVLIVIQFVSNIVFCIKILNVKFDFKGTDYRLLLEIAGFSFFIFLQTVMDQINWQLDKFVLARVVGSASIAVYEVGSLFNTIFVQSSTTISSVFTPRIHKLNIENKYREIDELMGSVGRIQTIVVCLVYTGFLFFGKTFVRVWAGRDYGNAYYIGVLIMAPLVVTLTQNIAHEICRARNVHRMRSVLEFGISIINLIISIPLCYKFDEIGCAIGTFISMNISVFIVTPLYLKKVAKIDYFYTLKERLKLIPSMVVPFIVGAIISYLKWNYTIKGFLIFACFYVIIYFVFIYFCGLYEGEKVMLKEYTRKIFKRKR
ncbi:MAG: oligosaccharide flippase family protein, partial [Lachnospiraceae bacterium]|nr:oligosaccharide flippase family protein [Lachnospiraceae bacterium]